MTSISLADRLRTIIDLIKSESFFVTLFVILLLTIIVLVVNIKVKSKAPKYAVAIVYAGLAILILARYGHYVLSLNDSIVDKFFRAMYFPNIVVYLSMLILTILFLLVNIINDKFLSYTKISSFFCFFIVWFLFVLTIDSVKKAGLSFYEVSQIYANSTIMVLMQASMYVIIVWSGILLSDLIIRKLSDRIDQKEQLSLAGNVVVKSDYKSETNFLSSIKSLFKKDDDVIEDYVDNNDNQDSNDDVDFN